MQSRVLAVLALGLLAACGSDSPTTVTSLPNVAGTYNAYNMWLVQFRRFHDGYSGSFNCSGSVTIVQSRAGQLSGFAVVSAPCPQLSFDLTGSVASDGSVTFTTGGPRPRLANARRRSTRPTRLVRTRSSARAGRHLRSPAKASFF
jgi:hypothetical protein